MGMIGNAPYGGTITGGNVADGSIETVDIKDKAVTASKLGDTAIADKLGYTPANRAGDVFSGNITGRGLTSIGTTGLIGSSTANFQGLAIQDGVARDAAVYLEANCADNSRAGGAIQVKPDTYGWRGHMILTYMADGTAGSFKINQFHPSNQATYNRLMITPSGVMTVPEQPSFSVSYSGGKVAAASVVVWNTTTGSGRHNTGGYYNASNGRFTAPVSGRYKFSVQVHHEAGAGLLGSHEYFDLCINGVLAYRTIGRWTVDDWYELLASTVLSLNANDYVTFHTFNSGNWLGGSRPDHNRFSGYLIG